MTNDYYVYEHIRLDNDTCFYVGKGHGERAYKCKRNDHHDRIAKKYGMRVIILYDNLTEDEAYELEEKTIRHYVFDLHYGIDIPGYLNTSSNRMLTNATFGGDGFKGLVRSDEWCKEHSESMKGSKNPMYGVNVWDSYDDKKAAIVREKLSCASKGENNPMFGVSPEQRMNKDTYNEWHKKVVERCKSLVGDKNPNYRNDTLKRKYEKHPELKMVCARKGNKNGRCRKTKVYDIDRNLLNEFDYIGECCEWMIKTYSLKTSVDSLRARISILSKTKEPYKKRFYFEID